MGKYRKAVKRVVNKLLGDFENHHGKLLYSRGEKIQRIINGFNKELQDQLEEYLEQDPIKEGKEDYSKYSPDELLSHHANTRKLIIDLLDGPVEEGVIWNKLVESLTEMHDCAKELYNCTDSTRTKI